jgi:hypothetical protein
MKQSFVIDVDTELSCVFVFAVQQSFTGANVVRYERPIYGSERPVIIGTPDPRFYGRLDALLMTSDKLANAEPIVPLTPIVPIATEPKAKEV